ncbi:hypothetical protein JXA84_02480 [candidate division WOR-3 bacterium]|nr:hypothetical protein [candidate division WOR-3 bacterium]
MLMPFEASIHENIKPETPHQIEIINGTFLGGEGRNYYGENPPDRLDVIWKTVLGTGTTRVGSSGERRWSGSGWTGQPLMVKHGETYYIIQGAFDHNLKKIRAETGELVWQYRFDDVIKGTGTVVLMPWIGDSVNSVFIVQGSRLGTSNSLQSSIVPSLRAVSFFTGEELWRFNVKRTDSYSRDADGSGIMIDSLFYIGLENGIFTVLNPDPTRLETRDGIPQPQIVKEIFLYEESDRQKHGGNLVVESSVSRIGKTLYICAGSGHVYGIDVESKEIVWDYFIGSDIDASPVVTYDSCLLVSIEKQYIPGKGGVFKLDPSKPPDSSVVWFFPTGNKNFADWRGGVVGSCAVNDRYRSYGYPALAAFTGIDGNVYVVQHDSLDPEGKKAVSPDGFAEFPLPKIVFSDYIGPSIATPLLFESKLIVPSYNGLFLYSWTPNLNFFLLDKFTTGFESTPFVWDRRIYIGSRDGYLYCFGEN